MGNLVGISYFTVISWAYTGSFRPPPPELPENYGHIREQRKEYENKVIKKILSNAVAMVEQYGKSGGYFVPSGRLSARRVLGASGHHHQNCQKDMCTSESSGKGRRIR